MSCSVVERRGGRELDGAELHRGFDEEVRLGPVTLGEEEAQLVALPVLEPAEPVEIDGLRDGAVDAADVDDEVPVDDGDLSVDVVLTDRRIARVKGRSKRR